MIIPESPPNAITTSFPPGTHFRVRVVDESYDYGSWTEHFPSFGYPEGLTTAQLAVKTAEKLAKAEAYRDRMQRSGQAWIDCSHPALLGEFEADADGAAEMWARLRALGLVADEIAA